MDPTLTPFPRDLLLLLTSAQFLAYVDVFVDDFLGLDKGPNHQRRHVRCNLFHALYKIFIPLYKLYPAYRKDVLSLNNLGAGDCSWYTIQVLIGWA